MLNVYINLWIAIVCGTAGWLFGASTEWYKSRQLVKELMNSYKEHDELLEAFYEMGNAQKAQQPGHPSLLRKSHLRPVN